MEEAGLAAYREEEPSWEVWLVVEREEPSPDPRRREDPPNCEVNPELRGLDNSDVPTAGDLVDPVKPDPEMI